MFDKSSNILSIENYKTIIFDFDGVIVDSNSIKEKAILESVENILSIDKSEEFVTYFTSLNGVPRERKIEKYVLESDYNFVLNKYERILEEKLKNVELIKGVDGFISDLNKLNKKMLVLSGGTQKEVLGLLENKGLDHFFNGVYGGPKDKEENLKEIIFERPVLYFGDSEIDYLLSKNNHFDFVFVYGATNIKNWPEKTSNWKVIKRIDNFSEI